MANVWSPHRELASKLESFLISTRDQSLEEFVESGYDREFIPYDREFSNAEKVELWKTANNGRRYFHIGQKITIPGRAEKLTEELKKVLDLW